MVLLPALRDRPRYIDLLQTKDSSIRIVPYVGGHWSQVRGKVMAVILIVEDEEQVRVLADSFLQAEGNKTLSAATIEQALALIEGDEPVDLLFVYLKIQDDVEGGLKLARKAVEARPNLRVLYTSGQAVTDGMKALFVEDPFSYRSPIRSSSWPRPSSPNLVSVAAQRSRASKPVPNTTRNVDPEKTRGCAEYAAQPPPQTEPKGPSSHKSK